MYAHMHTVTVRVPEGKEDPAEETRDDLAGK